MSSSASRTSVSGSLKTARSLREGMNPSPTRSRAATFAGAGLTPVQSHRTHCIRTLSSNLQCAVLFKTRRTSR